MSLTQIIFSIGAEICLALVGVHLLVWGKPRSAWVNLLFVCLIAMPVFAQQTPSDEKQVLFLNSYHPGYEWSDDVFRGIHSVLDAEKIKLSTEYLDSKRYDGKDYRDFVERLIRYKYSNSKLDAIIVSDHFAVEVALAMRETFQRGVPLVYLGIDEFTWERRPEYAPIYGIEEGDGGIFGTIDLVSSVQPDARTLYMVTDGRSETASVMLRYAREAERANKRGVTFKYLVGMSMEEVEAVVGAAPPHSAVLWLHFLQDKNGRALSLVESHKWLAEHSSAPVYCTYGFQPGSGVLGGCVLSGVAQGRQAAEIVCRLLKGASPPAPYGTKAACVTAFDYPVMHRFGIGLDSIPADSIVHNEPVSVFLKYEWQIIGVLAVIVVLVSLVMGLFLTLARRKKAERALSQSEQLARVLLNATSALTHLLDADGTIIEINDSMASVLGGTREELIGTNVFDRFPRDLAERRKKIMERVILEQRTVVFEDGDIERNEKVYETALYPIETSSGATKQVVVFAYDITARRQAEAALKESERRLRNAQKMAHIGNWELDLVKDKLVWSDEIFRIFEIDPASFDASYEAFLASVHPDDREAVNAAYTESLRSHTQYEMSHRLLMPDGRVKDVHEHCKTAYSPAGKPLRSVGTVQDITDRMRSEREATELRRELAHLGRTTTLNELASSLAHEINQPLGAILRNAEAAELLLGEDPPGLAEVADIIVDIRKDDQRASAIINRMREMVRRHDMTFEALSLKDVVDQVAGLVKVEAQSRGAVVGVRIPPGLPSVRGDAIHLQQVLLNLILNGLEAMDGLPCARVIEVQACLMDPETVEVAVRDRGRGIPAEALPRLFEAFFTTKPRGLGMGLLISRTCIESHGGKMWAENNPEGGATVRFTLKVAEGGGTA